jgi:mycoredoxin
VRLLRSAQAQLDREGIGYQVVDIEHDETAADFVMSVNGGNQTVPTVRFPTAPR